MTSKRALFALSCVALSLSAAAAACSPSGEPDGEPPANTGASSGQSTGASSGSSGQPNDGDYAEAPTLEVIEPSRATVGSAGPTVVVRGRNFVPRTVVQLDGAALETSFIDSTELRATMPSEKLLQPGVLRLSAGTAPPGGGATQSVEFTVENPVPTLTRVVAPEPPSVIMGRPGFTLELEGSNFVPGATVRWNDTVLTTTVVSATKLTAEVTDALVADAGVHDLVVENPAPGGGLSGRLTFAVSNPTVQLDSLTPTSVTLGASDVTLRLEGSGFVAASKVIFNGNELSTSVVSGTEMTAVVPAAQLQAVGDFAIVVQNPNPGGGISLARTFRVLNPVPRLTSLSPASVVQGAATTQVTLTGSNFLPGTKVALRTGTTTEVPATYVNATTLRIMIPASYLAAGGTSIDVRVENLGPGGGTDSLPFNVLNSTPLINDVSASGDGTEGFVINQAMTVAIDGANFHPNSQVQVTGASNVNTTFDSPTRLFVTLRPSQAALSFKVTSVSAADSNTVTRTACSLTANAWSLPNYDTYYETVTQPLFTGAPTMSLVGAGQCGASLGTMSRTTAYRAVLVQNTSGREAVLEAWARCEHSGDDAYLSMYRRATVPSTLDEVKQCVGYRSNGISNYRSLENPANATYCPGLVKGQGGQTIATCESMVVMLQLYDETNPPLSTKAPEALVVGLNRP